MFSLRQTCNTIPIDKTSMNKNNNNKSSGNSQAMRYSGYVNGNRRIFKTITEGQVTILTMIFATPNTATITYSYVANPLYVNMILTNIQDVTDTHIIDVYDNPHIFTGLRPAAYYTIKTFTVYKSKNRYLNVFENAIRTLNEGPPLERIFITRPQYNSAILNFTSAIGAPTSIDLTILNTSNITQSLFYPKVTSPFLITGLTNNITYDVSLSSFYAVTQNSYAVYKRALFQTYYENYPIYIGVSNIKNIGATIQFSFTGDPSANILTITNTLKPTNVVTITDKQSNTFITYTGLPIDSSYNLTITSVYDKIGQSGQSYPISVDNVFHTLNQSEIYGVTILNLYGNSTAISYIPASGNVLNYDISLAGMNGQIIHYNFTEKPDSILFPGLLFNTNYVLSIRSNYIDNSYLYTYPSYIKTLNEGAITNMFYSNITNTSAYVYFQPAPGVNQLYNITYQGLINNTAIQYIYGLSETYFNLIGLSIGTPYIFTVQTYYPNGNYYLFNYTTNPLFSTLNENSSIIVSVIRDNTTISVSFLNIYGSPSSVVFRLNSTITQTYFGQTNNQPTITFTGLTPATYYTLTVVTNYASGNNYPTTYSGNPIITTA